MNVVAVIPARGGSKGIPGKNLRRVGGVPLIVRAVQAALAVGSITRVIVSTDDPAIAEAARAAGSEVLDRPTILAVDEASSEDALLHAIDSLTDPIDILVFIQATSPFVDVAALGEAIERVGDDTCDVAFSAVETFEFLWTAAGQGVNHDRSVRPRRQDREPNYRETGAFYVMDAAGFVAARHRFFGRVGVAIVDPRSAIEIDDFHELELANIIAPSFATVPDVDVDVVVTDFDGVHTDDTVMVDATGNELVRTSRSDGMGVRLLREADIPVLILSTETNPVVTARARKLNVDVIQSVDDKATALATWAIEHGVALDRIAYIGNDVNDLGCLDLVGWPVAVPGSAPEVLAAARLVLTRGGGDGAVRELADLVLRGARSRDPELHNHDHLDPDHVDQHHPEHREWETPWLYPSVAAQ
jgi:YrbI family 3-deoxy-D-manno-octulosonate 8-phosphate phosphatase